MKKPRRKYEYQSEETKARQKRTQFGQPEGNKQCDGKTAVKIREFYRWCENEATEAEIKEYIKDKEKPFARRCFLLSLMKCTKVQDFFDLTNQTHGYPKQQIEQVELLLQ